MTSSHTERPSSSSGGRASPSDAKVHPIEETSPEPDAESWHQPPGHISEAKPTAKLIEEKHGKPRPKKNNRSMAKSIGPSDYVETWNMYNWCLGTLNGQITSLCVIGAFQVLIGSFFWMAAGGSSEYSSSFADGMWASWVMFVDPGTHTGLATGDNIWIRSVAVLLSLAGFTYFVTILGVVVDWIRLMMDRWTLLYNQVVMNDHVVILGWSVKTLFLIKELAIDNESTGEILELVVLCEQDRFESERTIRLFMQSCMTQEQIDMVYLVCWQGDPQESDDLLRVSLRGAKNIIIIGSGGQAQQSDQEVLRTILAIQGLQGKVKGRIIAEVCVNQNLDIIQSIGYDVLGIVARDMVNRVLVLSGVLPALGDVWADLMTFVGNELYCFPLWPDRVGKTWGELRHAQDNFVAVGIVHAGLESVQWSPPDEYVLQAGEEVLIIADDDEVKWLAPSEVTREVGNGWVDPDITEEAYALLRDADCHGPKVVCIIGWCTDTPEILALINAAVGEGSEVHILSPMAMFKRAVKIMESGLQDPSFTLDFSSESTFIEAEAKMPKLPSLKHITVKHYVGAPVVRHQLFALPIARADTIIILADDECEEPIESDSIVITTLLHLSHSDLTLKRKPSCEVCDWRSERIVRKNALLKTKGNFIRSSELETGMFALCAHHPLIGSVMRDLLDPTTAEGASRISQVMAQHFTKLGEEVSFQELCNRVKLQGDTLVGFQRHSADLEFTDVLNPLGKLEPRTWDPNDVLIVVTKGPISLLQH